MKPTRWTEHALKKCTRRRIDTETAIRTIAQPDSIVMVSASRSFRQRRYFDGVLGAEMLMRVLVEESDLEIVVVTVYITSKLRKYGEDGA